MTMTTTTATPKTGSYIVLDSGREHHLVAKPDIAPPCGPHFIELAHATIGCEVQVTGKTWQRKKGMGMVRISVLWSSSEDATESRSGGWMS